MKKLHSRFLSVSALLLAWAVFVPPDRAQTPVASTRVLAEPDGPEFYVDGTVYLHAMAAFWPQGSLHTLWAPSGAGFAYNAAGTIQYQFQNWTWSGGTFAQNPLSIIADPAITQYAAVYNVQYLFTLQVSCNPAPCTSLPGAVLMNGSAVNMGTAVTQSIWQSPGSGITLQVYPYPGWIFAGWQAGPGQSIIGFQNTVTLNAPMTVSAVFVPAKTINFATSPPNMQLYADRTTITTPYSMQWGLGTDHTLGEIDVQEDSASKRWVFASWSDGGAPSHTYIVGKSLTPETITANYTPAAYPLFLTSPPNFNLVVDGLTLPPPYSYIWGVGSTHTVTAPASQTDAQGNTWVFTSWDDLVTTPSRTITVPVGADVNGFRMIALYAEQARLTIGSSLAGLTVTVDGAPCTTPCSVVRNVGAQVHVSAPASVPAGTGSRQDFLGWSAGGAAPVPGDWVGSLTTPSTAITAAYHLMNSLTTISSPSGGASWSIQPLSPDGFYDSQTLVSLGVTAQPGYRFGNWSGDLSGTVPSASLTMSVPHRVVAQFSSVPYIAPTGVSNGAGSTPQPAVAPGSVASIFGVNLASATVAGPASPLAQTLAGVTAHIGSRFLPLYFASPGQINLQIPPDLATGAQTVTLSSVGMPDVSAGFTVARNAPGLFPLVLDGQSYALVLHEDGTLVTPDSPATIGELLTLYGTGFGPTAPVRPEGFALPATPPYVVLDPVTVQVGTGAFTPESAFAAPGQVGLDLVQFRLDSSAPSGTSASLYLNINGIDSNTLLLPIQ
jgi:uncharacterized protein (TIGR03437 family)